MKVALHTVPQGFFESGLPRNTDDFVLFAQKAAILGFEAVQIGPLAECETIDGRRLKKVLDDASLERNVHVGGMFDAKDLAIIENEIKKVKSRIGCGILLCRDVASALVSVHPPFFFSVDERNRLLVSEARRRFHHLLKEEIDFAFESGVKLAVESFCYPPFIFEDLEDFARFIFQFPAEKLGVLLDVGHVYQVGINVSEAVGLFKDRLFDVHIHDAKLSGYYRDATHLPIGKGTIDFPEVAAKLRKTGYDGWLTLEIRGTEKEILESKKRLEQYLSK